MKHKKLKQFRNKLVRLYEIGYDKELHHSAWYSSASNLDELKEFLPYSEPLLVAKGEIHQEPPISIDLGYANLLHVFYGDFGHIRSLEEACFGFGDALLKAKLLPKIEIPRANKQTSLDLLSLMGLIYFTASHELSIIDSVQIEYQEKADDFYFEYWGSYPRSDSLDPLRWFFGSTELKGHTAPPCTRIYTEQNLIRLAIESLDFQLFVLPGLKESKPVRQQHKTKMKGEESARKQAHVLQALIHHWSVSYTHLTLPTILLV